MILDLYIARRFLWLFLRVFAGFFAIMAAIGIIEELRRFSGKGITMQGAVSLSLLNVPTSLYQILPLIMILAAIGLFMGLAKSSELVVVRASGRSGLRFLAAPVATALLVGALGVAVWNPIMAATARVYEERASVFAQSGSVLSVNDSGLWLRQGTAEGQTVIRAQRANLDGTELFDVTFLRYGKGGTLDQRVTGAAAMLTPGAWVIRDAKIWTFADENPERSAVEPESPVRIATDLTRQKIADGFGTPRAVSIWDLRSYIRDLERAGFSGLSHRMWFQIELASPVFLAGMVLIAAGFAMRHARGARNGPLILMALLCGFLIFFLRNFGQVLGENEQIPILIAAWAPPLVAVFLSTGLLLHLEDG